jgi:pimeloyl-ACP methyl ester carboxylesterase
MTTVEANGVTLGVEHLGDAAAPLILLAGGPTMLSWPDALCEALARGGRHVVRYDLRDSGASSIVDPEAPTYTLRDLAADAAALARELDDRPAHLAGIGVGGMVAQVAALDYPDAFSALTLAGTRPVAPGRVDEDLPDHDAATMERLFSRSMPDWSDRAAVAEFAAGGAEILGDDPAAARTTAERIWDRTPGTEPAVQMANQLGMVFAKLDCQPRWRERLPETRARKHSLGRVRRGESSNESSPAARPTRCSATAHESRARRALRLVGDAEHADEHREAEQRVEDVHDPLERAQLSVPELVPRLDLGGREGAQGLLEPGAVLGGRAHGHDAGARRREHGDSLPGNRNGLCHSVCT